ncbi:MAG: hypothetical protein CXZ00_07280 [Acidobacteria bacterium]|nr:MAG: hypothetical protein CXZ00_07280 [Acidobacteriota bacterium]
MAEFTKDLSQEYWRPAPTPGNQLKAHVFQTLANEEFCPVCGTAYAAGARFCYFCGVRREDDLHIKSLMSNLAWLNFGRIREQFGLSKVSMALVLIAALFFMATVLTGIVYRTSTIAEWQAAQIWRIEWLLATVAGLLAAILFKTKL